MAGYETEADCLLAERDFSTEVVHINKGQAVNTENGR